MKSFIVVNESPTKWRDERSAMLCEYLRIRKEIRFSKSRHLVKTGITEKKDGYHRVVKWIEEMYYQEKRKTHRTRYQIAVSRRRNELLEQKHRVFVVVKEEG